MTYQEKEVLVPQSSQRQQLASQKNLYNNHNNLRYPSHLSPTQPLRVVCKTEERHFISSTLPSYNIDSSLKPIRFTMNDQYQPVQFRSEIVVHTDPDSDLRVQRLRVAFHFPGDQPVNSLVDHRRNSPPTIYSRSRSLDRLDSSSRRRGSQSKDLDSKRSLSTSRNLLHQWIDDLYANESLMNNDNIVFFIKNGEFFARI